MLSTISLKFITDHIRCCFLSRPPCHFGPLPWNYPINAKGVGSFFEVGGAEQRRRSISRIGGGGGGEGKNLKMPPQKNRRATRANSQHQTFRVVL